MPAQRVQFGPTEDVLPLATVLDGGMLSDFRCEPDVIMPICHEHNLSRPIPKQQAFGIRLKVRSTDPFKNLVGGDWTKEHWFATREERDRALKEMSGRYVYFRPGDQPTLEYEKIER